MNVNILAKSALAISAVIALITMMGGITLNNQFLINIGWNMFVYELVAIVVVTGIINLPKIVRAFN